MIAPLGGRCIGISPDTEFEASISCFQWNSLHLVIRFKVSVIPSHKRVWPSDSYIRPATTLDAGTNSKDRYKPILSSHCIRLIAAINFISTVAEMGAKYDLLTSSISGRLTRNMERDWASMSRAPPRVTTFRKISGV